MQQQHQTAELPIGRGSYFTRRTNLIITNTADTIRTLFCTLHLLITFGVLVKIQKKQQMTSQYSRALVFWIILFLYSSSLYSRG